jgi:hypothetical protein
MEEDQVQPESEPSSELARNCLDNIASELEYEKNHALFLGYKIEEYQPHILLLKPDAASRLAWWWLIKRSHGVLARRLVVIPKFSADRYDTLDFINRFNCCCELLCLTLEEAENRTPQIFAQSFLEGEYNRSNFTVFIDRINHEYFEAFTSLEVSTAWQKIAPDQE